MVYIVYWWCIFSKVPYVHLKWQWYIFQKLGTLEYLEVLVSNEDHQSYRDLILVISMLIDMG